MLIELRLENYAVIDNLAVEFASGLNLLTGETGAGKSILIDALALLLGDKASADVIRSGADRATISAVFEVESGAEKTVAQILENNGIDQEDESIILRREIAAGGKGRVFVNNQPATVAVLRQLAPYLATIHAQNESLLSFDASTRLRLLDSFANIQTEPTAEAFSKWKGIQTRIDELQRDEQDRLRLLDLWTFQAREIDEAKLLPGEDERLETEKRVLANAEKIYNAAMNAFDQHRDRRPGGHGDRRLCARRKNISKSWLATSRSFRRQCPRSKPPASAWKMSAPVCVTMPAALKLLPSIWRKLKIASQPWTV